MKPLPAIRGWLFRPVPLGRIAALRTLLYGFIFVDVLLTTSWVAKHGNVPGELYEPLMIGRVLPLPVPGKTMVLVLEIALLVAAGVAATGRFHRVAGWAAFLLYLEWMVVAFSYGKVDHDRFAFLVALAVLPSAGPAEWGEERGDEASGFAIHSIQVAVVLTYFLAAFAKFRFGGFGWVHGATLVRAVIRRGTALADPLLNHPWTLKVTQYGIVAFELITPLMLVKGRPQKILVGLAIAFHAVTFATISIIFLPHVMCLLAFLPLERLGRRRVAATT